MDLAFLLFYYFKVGSRKGSGETAHLCILARALATSVQSCQSLGYIGAVSPEPWLHLCSLARALATSVQSPQSLGYICAVSPEPWLLHEAISTKMLTHIWFSLMKINPGFRISITNYPGFNGLVRLFLPMKGPIGNIGS